MKAAEYVPLTERLAILRRDDRGGVFHLRAKLIGRAGYVYRTTDKTDLEAAKRAAFEIFYKLEALHDQGVVVGVGTFAKVYKAFERDALVHKSDARRRQFEGAFRRYFLPFFKEAPLTSINETKIRSFWEFRINYHASEDVSARQEKASKAKRGPKAEGKLTKRRSTLQNIIKPSAATLRVEKGLLGEFLRFAHSKGLMTRLPTLDVPSSFGYQKGGVSRRDHFTLEEMRKLRDHLRSWASEEADPEIPKNNGRFSKAQRGVARPNKMHRFQREVLRELILILANTGLRIGEALALRWSDLKLRKQKDGYQYLCIGVRSGKTGSREVIPKKNAATYLLRLKKLYGDGGSEGFVFRNYDGSQLLEPGVTFKKILTQLGMLTGPDNNRRSLYSLRHTYITNELDMGELSIYQIAQNAGTSVQYIEKHYSHASVHQRARQYAEPSISVSNRADQDMQALFGERKVAAR